jgi:hypothetical protein
MDRSLAPEPVKKRIGIRQNGRVEEMVKTESGARALQPGNGLAVG